MSPAGGGNPSDQPRNSSDEATRVGLPYVLVADADVERAAYCLEAIRAFKVGALVARDGEEASRLIERFGPPILLIADLSLSRKDGFAVIEALRGRGQPRSEIIAWSAFRELREFAANRLAGLHVRVLSGVARRPVIAAAIERALQRHADATPSGPLARATPEEIHDAMAELIDTARRLCRTPGVAVYIKVPEATKFRASVSWTSDDPIPHSPYYIPRVFGWILETGEALVLPDLTKQRFSDLSTATLEDVIQGLVAVPIVGEEQQVIGSLCVFDVKPLALGEDEIAALRALGRSVSFGTPRPAPSRPDTEREEAASAGTGSEPPLSSSRSATGAESLDSRQAVTPTTRPASTDAPEFPLEWPTALLDRGGGHFALARELARARREHRELSVVLFDLSGAREESDAPASFDVLLEAAGDTLLKAIRQSDLPIRWSHGELLVMLPGLGGTAARLVAERVRAALQAGSGHRAAVSAGIAEVLAEDTVANLVLRAKDKVREARERGHNRVA